MIDGSEDRPLGSAWEDPRLSSLMMHCIRQGFTVAETKEILQAEMHRMFNEKEDEHKRDAPCFSCGGLTEDGKPYFCVQRLRQLRGKSNFSEDRILEVLASLQICAPCMARAATDDLGFPDTPVPLLNLEKRAVHELASWLSDSRRTPRFTAASSDSCCFCHVAIRPGATYTRIEMVEESRKDGRILAETMVLLLAIICDDCARKYMVWL